MRILAIETSCDDTAIALVEASGKLNKRAEKLKFKVIKSVISSQIEIHRPWGGVVPNLAKREHIKNLPIIFKKLKIDPQKTKIDFVAVTVGPGLEPALWAGITFAKEIWKNLKQKNPNIKIIGVNHLEGHLYSFLLSKQNKSPLKIDSKKLNIFPSIALIVSGGHTILLKMDSLTKWKKLGETKDDAVGEAFDKVAKMLGFPYPGGPEIQRLAKNGDSKSINFPRPMIGTKDYNFSYSGLKTSVLYYLRDNPKVKKEDIAASFQNSAIDVLVKKTMRAVKEYNAKSVFLSGGVAANKLLRETLKNERKKLEINFLAPPMDFNTDNAVMIAIAGYINILKKKNKKLKAEGNMSI